MTLIPTLTFTDYERFPWSICNGCGMPAGNAYPSGHLVLSPILGLANAPIVETKFLELAMSLLDSSPRIPLGTFSILLFLRIPSLPPKTQFIKIKFINQGLDLLNISKFFWDHRVTSKIPQYFENLKPPLICYQYKKPIRNIIFNYNQVTSDPDVLNSIQSSWSCPDSPFLYPPAGHVVTGDLNCINDKRLRSLFKKGPKYKLPSRIDFTKYCRGGTSIVL